MKREIIWTKPPFLWSSMLIFHILVWLCLKDQMSCDHKSLTENRWRWRMFNPPANLRTIPKVSSQIWKEIHFPRPIFVYWCLVSMFIFQGCKPCILFLVMGTWKIRRSLFSWIRLDEKGVGYETRKTPPAPCVFLQTMSRLDVKWSGLVCGEGMDCFDQLFSNKLYGKDGFQTMLTDYSNS